MRFANGAGAELEAFDGKVFEKRKFLCGHFFHRSIFAFEEGLDVV